MAEDKIKAILGKTIRRIKPEKEAFKIVDDTIEKINALLKKNNLKAVCVAGGSYAKATILKDDFDIDLFVRFDKEYSRKEKEEKDISDISELLGKAISSLKPEQVHGSRDYYQLKKKNMLFEIVPVIKISNYKQVLNVTDMSPLHVNYVKKHRVGKPGLADQIRLAKQFCKAAGVYGAESYIRGFSGHVLDLMIIYYRSFENLLMQSSVWGTRAIIDIEKHLRDPLKELNKAKTLSPLIIVDPIQPDRNAAAAVSQEKYELFKKKAREFLEKPGERYFVVKSISVADLRKKAGNQKLIIVKAKPLKGKEDVVGAKIMKCFEHIQKQMKKHEFEVLESGWEFGKKQSILYFIAKDDKLPENKVLRGPPSKQKLDAKKFRGKHKKVFEKKGRLYAEEKREFRTLKKLVKYLIKQGYIQERVAKISY